jgi:glutaryl-CoA dehydrogenase
MPVYNAAEHFEETTMSQAAEKRHANPAILKDAAFQWEDPLGIENELTEEERMVRDSTRGFAQERLMPNIAEAYAQEKYDPTLIPAMAKVGLLGSTIPEEYGGAGLGYVCYGLIARELERVDSGYRSAMSVQSSLVMYPIYA